MTLQIPACGSNMFCCSGVLGFGLFPCLCLPFLLLFDCCRTMTLTWRQKRLRYGVFAVHRRQGNPKYPRGAPQKKHMGPGSRVNYWGGPRYLPPGMVAEASRSRTEVATSEGARDAGQQSKQPAGDCSLRWVQKPEDRGGDGSDDSVPLLY